MRLGEEHECQGDYNGCDWALAYSDDLAHVDRDLDVGWSGSDDGAIGTARGVRVAVQELAEFKGRQQ